MTILASRRRNMAATETLRTALGNCRTAFVTVGILSAALNILLLAGSLYMMLVYDSVIPSHSLPSLFALLALLVFVYLFQGLFELLRSRLLSAIAARFERDVSAPTHHAATQAARFGAGARAQLPLRDLDQIRSFLAGTGPAALFDLPWIVFFLGFLTLLHYWLGATALVGAIILAGLTALTELKTRRFAGQAAQASLRRSEIGDSVLRHIDMLTALGMRGRLMARWQQANIEHQRIQGALVQVVARMGSASRLFRMFLQSVILTVGALLVIDGQASGGVIFASSILSGRALAPVDQAIANWRGFSLARESWHRLANLLQQTPIDTAPATLLPLPCRTLAVDQLVVVPPGSQRPCVDGLSFHLRAGTVLGVIGPSAAGKTSLARALVGIWPPVRGTVRLDGATYDQWDGDTLGTALGYLPQTIELLGGTVAENIARFVPTPDSTAIIAAARSAGVHDMIVAMPQGYETPVGDDGIQLSAGQRQRIGLARALYGDPFLVVLDEPNSNLDTPGEDALHRAIVAIRERGGIAVVIAHRPSVLSHVDHLLLMRDGQADAFGPRDEVFARLSRTAATVTNAAVRNQVM